MDFTETENQRELAGLARKIFTERPEPSPPDAGSAGSAADGGPFDAALWKDLANAGVLAAALPESLGGSGLGLLDQCSVLVEAGRAVAPVPYLASIVLGAGTIARFGTQEQQDKWAAPAGRGELILTAALAEDDADSVLAPVTWAVPASNGGWTLTGVKTTVPYAPLAQLILVPAATPDGARVFLVEPGSTGVTIEPQELTGPGSAGRVTLNGVTVGIGELLGGGPGPGDRSSTGGDAAAAGDTATTGSAAAWLAETAIVGLCAHQAGVTAKALDLTAGYAKTREQFGKPIGSFQAVAQRLADAYVDVQAIQLTMWQAAWRLAAGLPAATEIGCAKFWAADGGHRVAHTAVHVHGGVGVDTEGQTHRYFTAAKQNEFTLGGATAQLLRVGAALAQGTHYNNPA
jgi:acyl-CoA dehydrogenase